MAPSPTATFASFFRATWVGQITLARYVVQWSAMAEVSAGANAKGDYRERFEAWLKDIRALGLAPGSRADELHERLSNERSRISSRA